VWLTPQITQSRCWAVSSTGGRLRSGSALWGLRLPTCKVLSPKFYIGWMTRAEMISERHSDFLLRLSWSDLEKVLRLFSSGLTEVVFWNTGFAVSLWMILMKWDTRRDPDEDWSMTATIGLVFWIVVHLGAFNMVSWIITRVLFVCICACGQRRDNIDTHKDI